MTPALAETIFTYIMVGGIVSSIYFAFHLFLNESTDIPWHCFFIAFVVTMWVWPVAVCSTIFNMLRRIDE